MKSIRLRKMLKKNWRDKYMKSLRVTKKVLEELSISPSTDNGMRDIDTVDFCVEQTSMSFYLNTLKLPTSDGTMDGNLDNLNLLFFPDKTVCLETQYTNKRFLLTDNLVKLKRDSIGLNVKEFSLTGLHYAHTLETVADIHYNYGEYREAFNCYKAINDELACEIYNDTKQELMCSHADEDDTFKYACENITSNQRFQKLIANSPAILKKCFGIRKRQLLSFNKSNKEI